jgi:C-terminal processing protease CtpA/Prc
MDRVIADSPASEAGIQVADSIIELDGTPVAGMGRLRQLFKQPGSSYTLKIERGGQPLTVKLKLRRLV